MSYYYSTLYLYMYFFDPCCWSLTHLLRRSSIYRILGPYIFHSNGQGKDGHARVFPRYGPNFFANLSKNTSIFRDLKKIMAY